MLHEGEKGCGMEMDMNTEIEISRQRNGNKHSKIQMSGDGFQNNVLPHI
jgi:hypothetical protein